MIYQTYGAPKSLNLSQLSDWLWGQEVGFGPVAAIGNDGVVTFATFEHNLDEPTKRATIRPLVDGKAVIPKDADVVCEGEVFILSQLQEVVVYR